MRGMPPVIYGKINVFFASKKRNSVIKLYLRQSFFFWEKLFYVDL